MIRYLAPTAVLLASLLAGCSHAPSAPPSYLLPSAHQAAISPVQVQVRLASYLTQGGIVMQLSDSELHSARQHRWAEPLASQLQRAMLASLAEASLPGGTLTIHLSQFQGLQGAQGDQAVITGVWQFAGGAQGKIHWQGALSEAGYAGLVRALDQGWQQVGGQIRQRLQE